MRSSQTLFTLLLSSLLTVLSGCHKQPPPEKLTKGGELYGRMCAVCHGANGEGYKADQAPRLAHPDFQASVTDSYLREAITNGRTGTTMSAWSNFRGGPLSRDDVEEVIKFMRTSWGKSPRVPLDEHPVTADLARAEATFALRS